jgi:hypothetical protein
VVEIALYRPLVKLFADLQTACLWHGKGARKARGGADYHSRSLVGIAGELALHFLARMLGLPARIMLPSLVPQPTDHLITVDSQQLAIQSKTSTLRPKQTVNTIYGRFKFFVDAKDEVDYYSFAILSDGEKYADTDFITVHLFAFVPFSFIQAHAVVDRQGRYITYEDLQATTRPFSHVSLGDDRALPSSLSISYQSYATLVSQTFDDRLLAALDAIDSPNDASRVLGMLCDGPDLLKAFKALNDAHRVVQPESAAGSKAASLTLRYSQDAA